jgi:hypothetical protein
VEVAADVVAARAERHCVAVRARHPRAPVKWPKGARKGADALSVEGRVDVRVHVRRVVRGIKRNSVNVNVNVNKMTATLSPCVPPLHPSVRTGRG